MLRIYRLLSSLLLAAALVAPVASTGCAARVSGRIYDRDHDDWHRWDDREDRAYRRYLSERREEYREFSRRNNDEQRDYWNWRHRHPDSDRR